MITKQIQVYGLVQGVGFRYFVLQKAKALNIKGFVKNEIDGSVYIEASATDQIVMDTFIKSIKQGPSLARVKKIFINDLPIKKFTNFQIR